MTEIHPLWMTAFYALLLLFAAIGVFATLGAVQHWNQQNILSNEHSISKNITIESIDDAWRFTDTGGNGYLITSTFSFSRMDEIRVGHTYSIKYFCNPLDNNARTVMEMIDRAKDRYICVINFKGVCE